MSDEFSGQNSRVDIREQWLQVQLGEAFDIKPLAGDASFRRYFRIALPDSQFVLMDAPPPHEDVRPFLDVRDWFEHSGLRVSRLQAADRQQGFLLLEDFGDETWATYRSAGGDLTPLFEDALRQLHLLQASSPAIDLPLFDEARMQRECELYLDWYLPRVAGVTPSENERNAFHAALSPSLKQLAALPRVPVHLDYHSRNLMLPEAGLPLGQIDYQDAVLGPVSYDLASLLYDCYQDYPEHERGHWSRIFFETLPEYLSSAFADFDAWHRALRLTALQRHIKAIGIFSRLAYRDRKSQFLDEIPLTRKHLLAEMDALSISKSDLPLLYIEPL
ncbi:MAG: phosphotransferase [Mariprofundus sp.]|nr:phosphotransferase [Mariprofundus sp.]